ncbi:polysaccharide pyruvyl transferase family protein [Altibacter sp.]|uniref:polysaccharide pyruvyl transferase family protein n=1 Tax=Altibacter sp. TaxID=2024823 RepID=UPI00258EDB34|nr:polysaccharide pyruvyl transferase family protein [Altibacter sp.]MCW9036441.1 polysaccharide pyruvyl transferase family protein [Altibacter sp.]
MPLFTNYGGILQAIALMAFLKEQGYDPLLLDRRYPSTKWRRLIKTALGSTGVVDYKKVGARQKEARSIARFIKEFIPQRTQPIYSDAQLRKTIAKIPLEAVITGSDQVWRMEYMRTIWRNAFLDFVEDPSVKKIAYAASFGTARWEHPQFSKEIKQLLSSFSAVSVREASGVQLCTDNFACTTTKHVLDPTLLMEETFYYQFFDRDTEETPKKGIYTYFLDEEHHWDALLKMAAKEYSDTVFSMTSDKGDRRKDEGMSKPTPGEWLSHIYNAGFVITDSYHGMLFSITFKKPFIAIANKKRGTERFTSLVKELGMEERLITEPTAVVSGLCSKTIDYEAVYIKLERWREASRTFLLHSLKHKSTR